MKRHKYIIGIILILCVLVMGLTYQFSLAYGQTDNSQQNIVNGIMESLKQKGVPVKSATLKSEDELCPLAIVDFIIQSQSAGDKTAPGEIIYFNLIGRAVNLAQRQGLIAGGIGYSLINTQGNTICRVVEAIEKKEQIPSDFNPPLTVDDDAVSALINSKISSGDISLDKFEILKDEYGFRGIAFDFRVADIEAANKELPNLINSLRANIMGLNSNQKTQIASYKINLNSASGEPLLIYINDLLFTCETWWHADTLSCKWYPHPPEDK